MKKDNFEDQIEHFTSETEDIVTLHQEMADGFMDLTAYRILPGILLVLNDIHTPVVPVNEGTIPQDFLLINYCIQGRCEFKAADNNYSYIDMNLMNIASKMVQDCFAYPSSFYIGYEIYVLPSMFTDATRDALSLFHVDPIALIRQYPQGIAFYAPDPVIRLWHHISEGRASGNIGQIRLDTLQLLKYLCDHKALTPANTLYLSRVQVMLAKKAKELLTADLSCHLSMKNISETLGISETSLKRYFRSVFGVNVSVYMNEARMKYAAELLSSSKNSISEIAKSCGYVNQGRFASIFREYYGMKPLDYRRKANCSILSVPPRRSGEKD